MTFVMAGGGTGGHVVPALAVARELKAAGHDALFIGTRRGAEATLVPRAGFPIDWIEIGGLQRVGWKKALGSLLQLPASTARSLFLLKKHKASAVFSMGGYVAAPVMLAAVVGRVPIVVMEPNSMPGMVTRKMAGYIRKALVSWPETARWFPAGKVELTGLPVREEFFEIPERTPGSVITVLVTGGSRGAASLNRAASESWPLFRRSSLAVRFILQCGAAEYEKLAREFNEYGLNGEVTAFIHEMPAAYAEADLIISRSGAGAVAEIAAAGKPAVLVPFPFAADDHQRHNAEELARLGGARILPETELCGERLFRTVQDLARKPQELVEMGRAARRAARRGAAQVAAKRLLEEAVRR